MVYIYLHTYIYRILLIVYYRIQYIGVDLFSVVIFKVKTNQLGFGSYGGELWL